MSAARDTECTMQPETCGKRRPSSEKKVIYGWTQISEALRGDIQEIVRIAFLRRSFSGYYHFEIVVDFS